VRVVVEVEECEEREWGGLSEECEDDEGGRRVEVEAIGGIFGSTRWCESEWASCQRGERGNPSRGREDEKTTVRAMSGVEYYEEVVFAIPRMDPLDQN